MNREGSGVQVDVGSRMSGKPFCIRQNGLNGLDGLEDCLARGSNDLRGNLLLDSWSLEGNWSRVVVTTLSNVDATVGTTFRSWTTNNAGTAAVQVDGVGDNGSSSRSNGGGGNLDGLLG